MEDPIFKAVKKLIINRENCKSLLNEYFYSNGANFVIEIKREAQNLMPGIDHEIIKNEKDFIIKCCDEVLKENKPNINEIKWWNRGKYISEIFGNLFKCFKAIICLLFSIELGKVIYILTYHK